MIDYLVANWVRLFSSALYLLSIKTPTGSRSLFYPNCYPFRYPDGDCFPIVCPVPVIHRLG